MEAAVKMQSMTAGKVSGGQKLVSQGTSVKNDNFNKLLQVKKDQAESADLESAKKPETGKPEEPKTEAGKPESGKTEDTSAKKPSDGTEESSADEMKEDVEATRQLEALQQVLLQQAAVQITEVEPEQQAVVEPAAAEGLVTEAAEAVTLEGTKVTESPHQANGGTEAESASITEIKAAETQEKTSKPVEPEKTQEPETVENTELKVTEPVKNHKDTGSETDSGEPKSQERNIRSDLENQRNQRTEGSTQDTGMYQSLNETGIFSANGRMEQPLFQEEPHSGVMSMKTTPQALPEDLGKTLAAKLPDTGKTLTIELEPASLGKLTIRMTYEAGRAAVSILATNPRTLEILNAKAAEIASILEEKTGQETVIVTQQPQEQEEYQIGRAHV